MQGAVNGRNSLIFVALTLGIVGCGESGDGGGAGMGSGGASGAFAPSGGFGGASGMSAGGLGGMSATGGMGGAGGALTGGTGGIAPTGGMGGMTGGMGGASGISGGMGGASGMTGGMGGMTGGMGGMGGSMLDGMCCDDGDCLCRDEPPSAPSAAEGPYEVDMLSLTTGDVYFPMGATPPFAAVAVCGGLTNTGPEMVDWGPFYASHGIATIITWTGAFDDPNLRAAALRGAIEELDGENTKAGSPLMGKLAGRYGTSGYSMGGGGTTIATGTDATLMTSVGLAAWGGVGSGVTTPTLLLCGESDTVADCNMSNYAYSGIPDTTPKMMLTIPGASHFAWFGPQGAGMGRSGAYALAFQKVFLEGDERWRDLLVTEPASGMMTTNIE
jgi:hypothetical protein